MDMEDEKIIKLFNKILKEKLNYNDNCISRKATEEEYFRAYLIFKSNSIYYSRFKFYNERTQKYITGKYLSEKYNSWVSKGIIEKLYNIINNEYIESKHPSIFKNISIDTSFIPNRIAPKKDTGMSVYYKSKYGLKINTAIDTLGAPIDISIAKGNENDASIAIERIAIIANKINTKKYKNSNKYKIRILGDGIYDSEKFRNKAKENDFIPITHTNIRNTKDPKKLKEKELNNKQKEILKDRHIVENNFAWMTQYSSRFYRVFYKKPINFLNELYITAAKILLKRI